MYTETGITICLSELVISRTSFMRKQNLLSVAVHKNAIRFLNMTVS